MLEPNSTVGPEPLLSLRGVEKRFGGTVALEGIDIDIFPGEVHAFVGENGAGKSTLGKILFGAETPDCGAFLFRGRAIELNHPADGLQRGLVGIAQELSLMPTRSVADNIMLAQELGRGLFVDAAATRAAVLATMEKYDLILDPDALVADLPLALQQRVEILRALSHDARLIIFDEPTARLTEEEAKTVRSIVRQLASAGCAVVYVSHFLEEVLAISDRVSILRNGKLIRSGPAAAETRGSLITAMTGAVLSDQFPPIHCASETAPEVLRVVHLCIEADKPPLNFALRQGEIVGFSGLVGAGRSEIGQAILGAIPSQGGVFLDGVDISRLSIAQRLNRGIGYIPENRREQGLMMIRPIQENVGLPYLGRISGFFGLSQKKDRAAALHHCQLATVKYGSLLDAVSSLSGGNQQKVLFARASLGAPKLLIVDEPTRGVDVGAKRKIYDLLAAMADKGAAVMLISSEIEEIMGLCHRVEVIAQGVQTATLSGAEITEQALMEGAFKGV